MRFLVSTVLHALALWATVLVLQGGLHVTAYQNSQLAEILTYLLLALIWGVVNATIGKIVKTVSLPLYCLTLGLFAIIVNAAMFWLVAWISGQIGFGLTISNFWWALGGALLMGLLSNILNTIFRTNKSN